MRLAGHSLRTPEEIKAESMPHVAPDTKRQMWACVICGEKRQYGEGRPDAESLKMLPFIRCNYCAGPTRHFYIGIVQEGV